MEGGYKKISVALGLGDAAMDREYVIVPGGSSWSRGNLNMNV
jgi:hypothetical protein